MNLSQFKVIPQSNITKAEPSLEDLKPLFVPEVIKPDLFYDLESERFRIKAGFLKQIPYTEGFTAIYNEETKETYLIKTSDDEVNTDFKPKFLRGSSSSRYFKSDYLRLLTKDLGNDLFLHETKIEDYQAFLVSNDKANPFEKKSLSKDEIREKLEQMQDVLLNTDAKDISDEFINNTLNFIKTDVVDALDEMVKVKDISDAVVSVKFSENPSVEENIFATNITTINSPFSETVSTEVNQTNEEAFTYTSDLLDQPVEEKVEEPSLF